MEKKRSPILPIVLAVAIGLMVIAILNGVIRSVSVVVAKIDIAPGTILSSNLVEVRSLPAQARPAGAFSKAEDVIGKTVAVARASGDVITTATLGDDSQAGLPSQLADGHVAMAINVNAASGVAGLLRPGQSVTVIGMLDADVKANQSQVISVLPGLSEGSGNPTSAAPYSFTPTATPTALPPASSVARIALSGLRVLMVPQSFRYEELPSSASQEELFASARTDSTGQEGSVIVLDVPTKPVEATPGMMVNPATLLSALNQYGKLYLVLEPKSGLQGQDVLTLNLSDLYDSLNAGRPAQH